MLLEQEVLHHHRSHATGATELRGQDGEVKEGEQEVPQVRVSVGQMSGAAQRCSILDSARELAIRDPQAVGEGKQCRLDFGRRDQPIHSRHGVSRLPRFLG